MHPADSERFREAVALAQAGNKTEASAILGRLLQQNPDNSDLLLWRAFTASHIVEARFCLERLQMVDPTNPSLPAALNWLQNQEALQPPRPETPSPTAPPATKKESVPQQPTVKYDPLGSPVVDGSNFIMSQSGGSFLVAAIAFIASSGFLILSIIAGTFLRINSISTMYGSVYTWIAVVAVFGISGFFLYFSSQDVMTRPFTATGQISNRQVERFDHRDRYGRVTDYDSYYYADFKPDNSELPTARLKLTENQYKASGTSSYAEVVYTRRLHYARQYQPLTLR